MKGKSNVIKRNVEKVWGARYTLGVCYLPKNTVLAHKHHTFSAVSPPTANAKTITLANCNHVMKSFGSSILINIIMIPS
jgi:hypothetical protein